LPCAELHTLTLCRIAHFDLCRIAHFDLCRIAHFDILGYNVFFMFEELEMHRTTKLRLSRRLGIPTDQLNETVAELLAGNDKNLKTAYKRLQQMEILITISKKKHLQFSDVLKLLK